MTIHWKAVKQYFTVVLFRFQFYPVCNFGKFISFGIGTVKREKVKRYSENLSDSEHNGLPKIQVVTPNPVKSTDRNMERLKG